MNIGRVFHFAMVQAGFIGYTIKIMTLIKQEKLVHIGYWVFMCFYKMFTGVSWPSGLVHWTQVPVL